MNTVTCYYFSTPSGKSPAKEFIDGLDLSSQRKFYFVMGLLQSFGHRLPEPHAKYIGDHVFELRFTGREGAVRVLYFFFNREKVIFTNGFIKKSQKTPEREKQLAIERRKIYFAGKRGER